MPSPSWAAQVAAAITESSARQVGAVPVVYPLLEALQVRETINALRWSRAEIGLGRVVEVLILNRLMSPQPLYHVGEWVAQTVIIPMFEVGAPDSRTINAWDGPWTSCIPFWGKPGSAARRAPSNRREWT